MTNSDNLSIYPLKLSFYSDFYIKKSKIKKNEWNVESIEHRPDFVIEGLIIEVIDLDGLEVLFRIEVTFGNQESLSENQFLL